MTLLQYSGRKPAPNPKKSFRRPRPLPSSSNKWVRKEEGNLSSNKNEDAEHAIKQPVKPFRAPKRFADKRLRPIHHSWKRTEASEFQKLPSPTTAVKPILEEGILNKEFKNRQEQRQKAMTIPTEIEVNMDSRAVSDGASESPTSDGEQKESAPALVNPVVCKYSRTAPKYPKKRKRPPAPKRIKINSTEEQGTTPIEEADDKEEPRETTKKEASIPKEGKELTDFAYRETKRRRRDGGNRGLVRVQKGSARICPTFLKGLTCSNERCMKRHDVPAEFAMPVCSFFQRQGMCLKEDCKFRHVKVNIHATKCPMFELLGYCEDETCRMLHSNRPIPPSKFAK